MKPQAAITMIAISRFFTKRISAALSYLSASWPLVAENSRKGSDEERADHEARACAGGSQPICSW